MSMLSCFYLLNRPGVPLTAPTNVSTTSSWAGCVTRTASATCLCCASSPASHSSRTPCLTRVMAGRRRWWWLLQCCTQYLHSIYTVSAQYLHSIYTVSTQYLHSIYTVSTQYADIYAPLLTMLTDDSPVPGLRLLELGQALLYIPHTPLHSPHSAPFSGHTHTLQHCQTDSFQWPGIGFFSSLILISHETC